MRRLLLWLGIGTVVFTLGCSSLFSSKKTVVVPYTPAALASVQSAREYTAQGRYELAKEQYLIALTASNSPDLTKLIHHELAAAEMMIQTQR